MQNQSDMTPNLPPVLPEPIGYKSIAWWPYPSVDLGDEENKSEDNHHDRESAESVCRMLETRGFGGDGKIFPLKTEVDPIYPDEPIARANGIASPGELILKGGEGELFHDGQRRANDDFKNGTTSKFIGSMHDDVADGYSYEWNRLKSEAANGIGGEPTFDGVEQGEVIPADPSAGPPYDLDAIREYILTLKEGDRVVECGISGMTGTKGTVYLSKEGDICVRWDRPKGMGTSATGGTRRISDVIQPTSNPCESESPKPDEGEEPTAPKPEGDAHEAFLEWTSKEFPQWSGDMDPTAKMVKAAFLASWSDLAAARSEKAELKLAHSNQQTHITAFAQCLDGLLTPEQKNAIHGGGMDGYRDARDITAIVKHLLRSNERLRAALEEVGGYTGKGGPNTPWQEIVRDMGQIARAALAPARSGKGEG